MTFPSGTPPDLPPGTVLTTTEAASTYSWPINSSHLHTPSPETKTTTSASESFSTDTPTTNAILPSTQKMINMSLTMPPYASQTGERVLTDISTFAFPLSNPHTSSPSSTSPSLAREKQLDAVAPTTTQIPSTSHHVFAGKGLPLPNGYPSNVPKAKHKENVDNDSGSMRDDSISGPVVMPLLGNSREVSVNRRRQSHTSWWSSDHKRKSPTSDPVISHPAAEDRLDPRSLVPAPGSRAGISSVGLNPMRLPSGSSSSSRNGTGASSHPSTNSSMLSITSVAPTTSIPNDDLSSDYQADDSDVITEDSPPKQNASSENGSTDLDLSSLRKKFLLQFTNTTDPPTSALPNNTPSRHSHSTVRKTTGYFSTLHTFNSSIDEDHLSFSASSVDNSTSDGTTYDVTTSTLSYTTPLHEITAPILLSRNVTSAANVTSKVSHAINKEQLQFPGITLKVSHVLIPKQKRSRYNIQNMRIELPKTESLNKAPASVPKTSKNSNCTRFPVLVVTAADAESKEKVNLTEERYDCEFSSQIPSSTQQKEPVDRIRTYYGGYVFRYTIPKASNGSNSTDQLSTEVARTTDMTTVEDGDDYYPSYGEYLESANGSSNSGTIDDAIFPDPIVRNEKVLNPRTEEYTIPLTESTIIDSDLHDRDVIDSVMYIYFGGASRGLHGAGSQIIIVGAVIALVAQFLTLASSIRRIKTHQGEEPTIILLNVEIALTLTNLIFILGVQSPGNHTLCRITAVSLYYLHLVTLFWFLLSSLHCVQSVIRIEKPFKLYIFCICGWILPLIIALLSYLFNERSFETSSYCWVSPLRGILFSYILPVIFLCSVCIVTTVYGLRRVTDAAEELDDTYSHRKLLRISAVSLPLFSIIWFTGMISLENSSSLLFSMIYLISNTVLNWLLFGCWLPTEASQWKDMDEDYYDDDEDFDDEPVLVKRRFDDQPLLSELYEYGAQGQLYNLRIEPISIISAP